MKKSIKIMLVGLTLSTVFTVGGATAGGYAVASYASNKTEQIVNEEKQNAYDEGFKEGSADIPAKDQQIEKLQTELEDLDNYISSITVYGLYDEKTNERTNTWSDLIKNDVIKVENGVLNTGKNKNQLFGKTLNISDKVTSIKDFAFKGTGIKAVVADKLEEVSQSAFSGCNTLTSFSAKNAIKVGNGAFNGCTALVDVNLENVTNVDSVAFYGCSALKEINLKNVTTIKNDTFGNCTSLTTITAENATMIEDNVFRWCSNLETVNMPNVEIVKATAFQDCTNLTTFTSTKLKQVDNLAFADCDKLKNISLENVTSIGNNAFTFSGLENAKLQSLENIGNMPFYGCSNLKTIYLPENVIWTWSKVQGNLSSMFEDCSNNLIIYCGFTSVPESWSDKWNYNKTNNTLTTKYGYTYEQYLAEINTGENT